METPTAREVEKNRQELLEMAAKALRAQSRDLRKKGLEVAVHNDYRVDGTPHTFWLMTWARPGTKEVLAFKGEGRTDEEALDQIRARFAEVTDRHKHAPRCPANHYHGKRAPTGDCSCGAVRHGVFMYDDPNMEDVTRELEVKVDLLRGAWIHHDRSSELVDAQNAVRKKLGRVPREYRATKDEG